MAGKRYKLKDLIEKGKLSVRASYILTDGLPEYLDKYLGTALLKLLEEPKFLKIDRRSRNEIIAAIGYRLLEEFLIVNF